MHQTVATVRRLVLPNFKDHIEAYRRLDGKVCAPLRQSLAWSRAVVRLCGPNLRNRPDNSWG